MVCLLLSVFPSLFHINTVLFGLIGLILTVLSYVIVNFFPLAIMQQVSIHSGNITSVGLNGITHFNQGSLVGFNGIKISRIDTKEMYLFGFCLMVFYLE